MNQYFEPSARRVSRFFAALVLFAMVANALASTPVVAQTQAQLVPDLLVYHQITNLDSPYSVVSPEISADGAKAVFSNPAGASDPNESNHIYIVNTDGTDLTQVDSYKPLCGCGSSVDLSADGSVVVSTDGVQVRAVEGGSARELFVQGGEITAMRLTADGTKIYFLFRRDTATVDGFAIERGVWQYDLASDELSPVTVATDLVAFFDLPEPYGCCLPGDVSPLDISADGSRIVFAAYGADGEYLLGVNSDGGNLHELAGPFAYTLDAAISADGSTVAYDAIRPENQEDEVGVLTFDGGESLIVASRTGAAFSDVLRLSEDGSKLLLTPSSYLIDTATGGKRQLAVQSPGGSSHSDVLTEGMARASMSSDATRFLYVIHAIRCADCANLPEQLATLDLDAADPGDAPTIAGAAVDPGEIQLDRGSMATATASIETDGVVISFGLVALLDGIRDPNVADRAYLLDDGLNGDARANDGIYTFTSIFHAYWVAREDDAGPRTLLFQAEVESADGRRHAVAMDFGTLDVVPAP